MLAGIRPRSLILIPLVDATDPGPGRLIRRAPSRSSSRAMFVCAVVVAALPVMGCLHGADNCPVVIYRSALAAAGVRWFRGANAGRR